MSAQPAFVISDRDKGIIPAMENIAPGVPHFHCFQHLMKNFNRVFKSKELKNKSWLLAHT